MLFQQSATGPIYQLIQALRERPIYRPLRVTSCARISLRMRIVRYCAYKKYFRVEGVSALRKINIARNVGCYIACHVRKYVMRGRCGDDTLHATGRSIGQVMIHANGRYIGQFELRHARKYVHIIMHTRSALLRVYKIIPRGGRFRVAKISRATC